MYVYVYTTIHIYMHTIYACIQIYILCISTSLCAKASIYHRYGAPKPSEFSRGPLSCSGAFNELGFWSASNPKP